MKGLVLGRSAMSERRPRAGRGIGARDGDAALLAQLFSLPHPPAVEQRRPGSAAAVRMVVSTREDASARRSLADFPLASAA